MARFKTSFTDGHVNRDSTQTDQEINQQKLNALIQGQFKTGAFQDSSGNTNREIAEQLRIVLEKSFPRKQYTVQPDDTPQTIADAAGISIDVLLFLNPELNQRDLNPGEVIQLPYTSKIGTLSETDDKELTDRFKFLFGGETITAENNTAENKPGENKTVQTGDPLTVNTDNAVTANMINPVTVNTDSAVTTNAITPGTQQVENDGANANTNNTGVTGTNTVSPVTTTTETPATVNTPVLPADRSGIALWVELSPAQKTTFHWDEVLLQFKEAQPKVGLYELNAWTRKQIRDGWNFGDAIPLLYEARQVASLGGIPVIEAYHSDDAWIYARNMGLPKNADAPFYWQTKFGGARQKFFLNYAPEAQYDNLRFNREYPQKVDFTLLCEVAGNTPEDKALLKKITDIKEFTDKLLSEEFLILTSHAQITVYKKLSQDELAVKANGIHTPVFYDEMQVHLKEGADQKAKDDAKEKALLKTGIPDENNGKLYTYKRDGGEFKVVQSKLAELRKKIAGRYDGTVTGEALVDYISENFKAQALGVYDENCLKLLLTGERITILDDFVKYEFLRENECRLIPLILKTAPIQGFQREQLYNYINANNKKVYRALWLEVQTRADILKDFYEATETVSVYKTDAVPVYDRALITDAINAYDKKKYHTTVSKLPGMTSGQISTLSKDEMAKLVDACYLEEEDVFNRDSYDVNDIATPLIAWSQFYPKQTAEILTGNNFDRLCKLYDVIETETINRIRDEGFETAFAQNDFARNNFNAAIDNSTNVPFYKIIMFMPESVIRDMDEAHQLNAVKVLVKQNIFYSESLRLTVVRILHNVGEKNYKPGEKRRTPAEIAKSRHDFYNKMIGTSREQLTEDRFYETFQGQSQALVFQELNSMKEVTLETQMTAVKDAGDFGKDDQINMMTPANMGRLELDKRKEYIRILLGKTVGEEPYNKLFGSFSALITGFSIGAPQNWTRVGESDEESLLLLVKTCPTKDYKTLMDFIAEGNGNIYKALDAAIHGQQYKRLHDEMAIVTEGMIMGEQYELDAKGDIVYDAFGAPVETETYKAQKAEKINLQFQMEQQGLNHPNVVPWADPGMLKQLFTGAKVYEYQVSFTPDNKIQVDYYTDNIWSNVSIGVQGLAMMTTRQQKIFDPGERIGVLFLRDDVDLAAHEGEVRMMPAIGLYYLKNKQTNRQITEAIDVAVIALSIYTLGTSTAFFEIALAVGDLAYSLSDLVLNGFKDDLSDETRAALETLNSKLIALQLAGGGIMAIKALRHAAVKLAQSMRKVKLADDVVTALQGQIARAEGEAKLFEQLETLSINELARFEKDLAKLGARMEKETLDALKLKVKMQIARATGDERLIAQAAKEREALAAKNEKQIVANKTDDIGQVTDVANKGAGIHFELAQNEFKTNDLILFGPDGKKFRMKVNVDGGEIKFVPATKADAEGLKYLNEEMKCKVYEEMQPVERQLVKKVPLNSVNKIATELEREIQFSRLTTKSSLTPERHAYIESMVSSAPSIKFNYSPSLNQTPLNFLNETGENLFDIVFQNGAYAKFDMTTGRLLFVEGDFHAFVEYVEVSHLIDPLDIKLLLTDRVIKMRRLLGYEGEVTVNLIADVGGPIQTNVNKVTTFIGKTTETIDLKKQFGNFRHIQVGETPGSVNLLNMPDPYWNPATWFKDYNRDWMLRAINREDDIYIASEINFSGLYNKKPNGDLYGSYYANELNELVLANMKPINISQSSWNNLKNDIIQAAATKY